MMDKPSSSGVALHSSTGWYAVYDKTGASVGNRIFGSSFRAAEWASAEFDKPWPALHADGFTVWGGVRATSSDEVEHANHE